MMSSHPIIQTGFTLFEPELLALPILTDDHCSLPCLAPHLAWTTSILEPLPAVRLAASRQVAQWVGDHGRFWPHDLPKL